MFDTRTVHLKKSIQEKYKIKRDIYNMEMDDMSLKANLEEAQSNYHTNTCLIVIGISVLKSVGYKDQGIKAIISEESNKACLSLIEHLTTARNDLNKILIDKQIKELRKELI